MSFSASLFFPERAKQFDFMLSEKFNWFSILTIILYPLLLIFIEKSFGCEISSYAYYVLILPFITYIIGGAIRLNEYENLNGILLDLFLLEIIFLLFIQNNTIIAK
ncbi:hypothetical protein [Flavobacterium sp.]|uniref:hypothetical protein n=1 Tax=Flavobacterium sp. TaxID=239 RepID=UPI003D0E688B